MPYTKDLPARLAGKGLITADQQHSIDQILSGRLISLYFDLRVLMYLGVLLLTGGLGILVYKNFENIGHVAVLSVLIGLTIGCFVFVLMRWKGFSLGLVESESAVFDYILLLGALMFATSVGYAEFIFQIFSGQHAIVALFIGVFYFICAYAFDHRGILVLSFASFAASLGLRIQSGFDMIGSHSEATYELAFLFGSGFCLLGLMLDRFRIKRHFTLSYINVCGTVFQIAALTSLFEKRPWSFLLVVLGCVFFFRLAVRLKSFALVLNAAFFAFMAFSYFFIRGLLHFGDGGAFILFMALYVIASGVMFVLFIKHARKHKLFNDDQESV